MRAALILLFGLLCAVAYADAPATQPATQPDSTMDWILSHATTAPATQPDETITTEPTPVLSSPQNRTDARPGVVTLSNDKTIRGSLSTTLQQPFHIWIEDSKQFTDIPFSLIKSIQVNVVWERQQPEWKFAASGSDIKEYSGRTYPARQTDYIFTLKDGSTVTGAVAAPIYVDSNTGETAYILHKRDKGDPGQTLNDLVYVKSVVFND